MPTDGDRALDFLKKLSFPRLGGSQEEKKAAEMIAEELRSIGLEPRLEEFEVWSYANPYAKVEVLEPYTAEIEASALGLSGSTPPGGIEAPLKYIETGTVEFINDVEGCITLATGNGGAKGYERSKKKGVLGRILIGRQGAGLFNLAVNSFQFERFGKLPSAWIRYEDGLDLIRKGATKVRLIVSQDEFKSMSRNVVVDIPGTSEPEEIILIGAHYDSVYDIDGAHDNAAGSATILEMARHFAAHPARRTLRFVWFGTEELGLKGSWAYIERHADELKKHVFMVNVDVAGSIIGTNNASVMASDKVLNYLDVMGKEYGIGLSARSSIYSGDCIPLGYKGVPSVTFARGGGGPIHTKADTACDIDAKHLAMLGDFVLDFTVRMANSVTFPFPREIPESIRRQTREYIENAGKVLDEGADKK
ncbi:MAG TPA: Zn-dependent exopeptidase M28 [Firmicutes bacterium]|nr:Zn-dependent exopeptidase M28 [Candidatus Fermentithermobacillaceae bacterium]